MKTRPVASLGLVWSGGKKVNKGPPMNCPKLYLGAFISRASSRRLNSQTNTELLLLHSVVQVSKYIQIKPLPKNKLTSLIRKGKYISGSHLLTIFKISGSGYIVPARSTGGHCQLLQVLFHSFSRQSYFFLHSGRRPPVQNVFVIAQGHGVRHASPIEAAGQWFYCSEN